MQYARKAIVAGLVGLIGSFTTALSDGDITVPEIIVAALTAVTAAVGVYQTTNEPQPPSE